MSKLPLKRDCFVTSITLATLNRLGQDALEYDPLVLRDAFESVFGFDRMPQRMFDKLNCGLSMIGTTCYTDTIEGFLSCTAVMNNLVIDGDTAPFVTYRQCAWGVWEYINLNGDVDAQSRPTERFSPDIVEYIRQAANLNGISRFPAWLQFAQPPNDTMPDLSSDVDLFSQYMARQEEYVEDTNRYVEARMDLLKAELAELHRLGFVG